MYQASDAPRYFKANKAILGVIAFNIAILYPATYFFYKTVNKKRADKWDNMTSAEKSEYLKTTKDEGNKRLDFRFDY